MNFHHIGIACEDIDSTLEKIKKTYDINSITDICYDECQDANLCLITTNNGINIELISGNKVATFIKKRISYYHVCYTVANLDKEVDKLVNNGHILVSLPQPAKLFNNRRVVFLLSETGLIELLEEG